MLFGSRCADGVSLRPARRSHRRRGRGRAVHLDLGTAQIKAIVNNVVFPVIDVVLVILFFVKVSTSYFEYRKHGQFEFAAPAILFACLVFTLTAPLYIWGVVGI